MVSCEEILVLLMGYIDDELDPDDRKKVEEHLKTCPLCARELEAYKRLGSTLDAIDFVEPADVVSNAFKKRLYNRAERVTGWILSAIGLTILIAYALYQLFTDSEVHALVKTGVAALVIGGLLLVVSVIRLRLRLWRVDRYKGVKR